LGSDPVLPYRERAVTFAFSPATFLQEGRARTQVRLVGFEDEWRDTEVFQARYTGLPAGSYRFEVRTRSPHGDLGPAASQTFKVLPPWWKTWWAYALYGGTASGVIFLAFRWRTRIILQRMVELESLVHERTWNLEDANKALSVANQALEEASMVDPLTGLKNRRFLGLSLPEELARVQRAHHQRGIDASQQDLAFLLVDLDHFKAVNDTYGHAAGDAVLRQTAAILRAACRDADSVVRWGGEEFLIVAKATDRNQVEAIARKIRDGMRAHTFDLGSGQTLAKTCSVGFSAFPVLPHDPQAFGWEDAVELADQSLYAAKKSGRDGWVGVWVHSSQTEVELRDRLLREVPQLVREGVLRCVTSFPEGHRLVWKD
jgi:diguanylate cyclase (GGDEF)-like protein